MTRKQCLGLLKQICGDAVEDGILEKAPFRTSGRRRVKMRVDQREMHVLNEAQQQAFVRHASGLRLEALFVLAVASGMREGELLALRWGQVFVDHVIVQRRLDARTRKRKQTKSATSVRRIDLDASTIAHLEVHRKRLEAENLAVGPSDLVFPNEVGKALSASNLLKRDFHPLVADAGLPEQLRFHDLRHSHATLLLSRGVNPKVVQERLGHESVKTTLDLYGHVFPTAQRDAAALVGSVLFDPKSLTLGLTNRTKKRRPRASPKEETLAA